MAYSPSHRSAQSVSPGNLQAPDSGPGIKQQRRMTSPASSSSLNPPIEERRHAARPPSPLRNGFIPDTSTGINFNDHSDDEDDDDDDDAQWRERSPSPSSSVSQLAANLSSRVGNFLGGIGSRSQASLPSDAQLEAEAERERDRSRREAERILTREAEERRRVEERVLAMMETTKGLPPPPSRSQTLPNPSTPSGSPTRDKESWWAAAKNKLTPEKYKEPLTPAQQIIQEAKSKDKDRDKKGKGKEKEKEKDGGKEWGLPSPLEQSPDPSTLRLSTPQTPMSVHRKPVPPSPSSPTPSRPSISNMAPNLTPSPMRSTGGTSPSREAPPMYAQFNGQGTLDVAGTLLTIARRFEKLEKWTVGHVRALEERMSDVERWLVDKEKEKKKELSREDQDSLLELAKVSGPTLLHQDISDMKENITELQGRVGELGREIAKIVTSPSKLSSGPSRSPPMVSSGPTIGSSFATHEEPEQRKLPDVPIKAASSSPVQKSSPITTPTHSRLVSASSARDSTSPPLASSRRSSGGRLPYPTGDYALPPDPMSPRSLNTSFSPPTSPTSSLSSIARTRPLSIHGTPNTSSPSRNLGLGFLPTASNGSLRSLSSTPPNVSGLPGRAVSPQARAISPQAPSITNSPSHHQQQQSNLAAPPKPAPPGRQSSVSPTPRKRYTVALGEPLVAPESDDDDGESDTGAQAQAPLQPPTAPAATRQGRPPRSAMPTPSTAFFSSTPGVLSSSGSDGGNPFNSREPERGRKDSGDRDGFEDETIGKSSSRKLFAPQGSGDYRDGFDSSPSPASKRRIRAQSAYGFNEVMGLHKKHQQPGTPTPGPSGPGGLVPPLRPRVKSRSIENFDSVEFGRGANGGQGYGAGGSASSKASAQSAGAGSGRFVDPLVLRRQDKEGSGKPATLTKRAGTTKVPVGQLVAFFQDKKP